MRDSFYKRQPVDLHVHTTFSIDVTRGNTFLEYMEEGDKLDVVPGFLDHFQSEKLLDASYPFNEANLSKYFETIDIAKASGFKKYLGLEVDWYDTALHQDWNDMTADFLHDHKNEFDYFVGTVHDVFTGTITIPFELQKLMETHDFASIQDAYFKVLMSGIDSGLFDGFAHLDVVFRFCGEGGLIAGSEAYHRDARTWAAMERCFERSVMIELNLRGFDHPWRDVYPAESLFTRFCQHHNVVAFFIGSDSHDLVTFQRFARVVKKYHATIREQFFPS